MDGFLHFFIFYSCLSRFVVLNIDSTIIYIIIIIYSSHTTTI